MSQVCDHLLVIFLLCTQQQVWLFVVFILVTKDDDKPTIIFRKKFKEDFEGCYSLLCKK
jgi:hypothetical protein